ncbi:hypothetical protein CF54_21415 [Streptomyces sp. Tu 6176]|nr:hypothetical protein CF54_21415 [Streptomyces sp. Tu 6176]
MRSGTSGFSSTIERGSGRGTCGTCTRPAPSRARPEEPAAEPELRTDTDRLVDRPDTERDNRPDTDRGDLDDCDDVRPLGREPPLAAEPLPPPMAPVGAEATRPVADTTGARPQVSQYSSPPPTSSYAPPQSGR